MYAAVKAGPKGLLISNDEMRDHMFQLLAPRFFHKWKQRHQASGISCHMHACPLLVQNCCYCKENRQVILLRACVHPPAHVCQEILFNGAVAQPGSGERASTLQCVLHALATFCYAVFWSLQQSVATSWFICSASDNHTIRQSDNERVQRTCPQNMSCWQYIYMYT